MATPSRLRSVLKRVALVIALLVLAGVGYLAVKDAPLRTTPWTPAPQPAFEGVLAVNERLRAAERIGYGEVDGPECVAVDAAGRLYAGCADGRIVRATRDGGGRWTIEPFAETGGRPLGLKLDREGHLIVGDAYKGLLRVDPKGQVTVLATEAGGVPIRFADDMDIAKDGTIYFSDASTRYQLHQDLFDVLSGEANGRLLAYDPKTGATRVVLGGLYFANGVALAKDERFIVITETTRYRLRRFWLAGPKAGQDEVIADNLPGFPDGARQSGRGTFWVACFTVRKALVDRVLHPRPFLKDQLAKLPKALWPKPDPYGLVLEIDEDGRILQSLHDPGGAHVPIVTSADEVGGFLYLGTLRGPWMARLALQAP